MKIGKRAGNVKWTWDLGVDKRKGKGWKNQALVKQGVVPGKPSDPDKLTETAESFLLSSSPSTGILSMLQTQLK